MNYDLKFVSGELYPTNTIYRVAAVNDKGTVLSKSVPGFGFTEMDSVKDFIRRNTSDIIDQVFDIKDV